MLHKIRVFNQKVRGVLSKTFIRLPFIVDLRCLPFDRDPNDHPDNPLYKLAELTRWNVFAHANLIPYIKKHGIEFNIVEKSMKCKEPMNLFHKYSVFTTPTIVDKRWIRFDHVFVTQLSKWTNDSKPVEYAVVKIKFELKDKEGNFVCPDKFVNSGSILWMVWREGIKDKKYEL